MILDDEERRGTPVKGPHREVVGATVMDGELFCEVLKGEERVGIIKPLLVLPVAALYLTIVPWGIWTDKFVPNTQSHSGLLKEHGEVFLAVGKAVGELKAIIRLDTLHIDSAAGIPLL